MAQQSLLQDRTIARIYISEEYAEELTAHEGTVSEIEFENLEDCVRTIKMMEFAIEEVLVNSPEGIFILSDYCESATAGVDEDT